MTTYTEWQTFRTECGNGRVTYHPEWSTTHPWVIYINGTAAKHLATLNDAENYFMLRGMILDTTKST